MIRVVIALLLAAGKASADVELWTEVGVQRDVTRRIAITADQNTRFDSGGSRLSALIPEVAVRVRLQRWLRFATAYRFEYERDGDDDMVVRHRIDVGVRARAHAGPVRVSWETELQEQLRPESRDHHRHVLRDAVELAWRGGDWVPAASLAVFHRLGDGETGTLDRVWLTARCARMLGSREAELFYRLELPRADPDDPTVHIVGLAFHSEL